MTPRCISVLFTPPEIDAVARVEERIGVVVDVLRATTVIPAGLAAGASAFFPTTTVDEARALRQRMPGALLCGERDGIAPPGFDLGNSPLEYTSDRVRGRELVFTSTNGASALLRLRGARQIVTAAFVNAGAVARAIVSREEDVLLVASGKAGRSCLEDTAGCGSVIERLLSSGRPFVLDDAAHVALVTWKHWETDVRGLLSTSQHGAWLETNGWANDLDFCARTDILDIVPALENDRLIPLVPRDAIRPRR